VLVCLASDKELPASIQAEDSIKFVLVQQRIRVRSYLAIRSK
jgi:hypothetical protein